MLNRIKEAPTLEQSYPEAGIFQTLRTTAASSYEWAKNTTEAEAEILDNYFLDQFYFRKLNRFGQKISTDIEYVVNSLLIIHGVEWDRLYTDYTAEYNPIWNVDGTTTETETRNLTKRQTGTGDFTDSGTDTETRTGTDKTGHDTTDTETRTGTETHGTSGTDTLTLNTTDTTSHSGTDTETRTGTETHDTSGTDTDTTTNSIQGFNSDTYAPESQNIETVEKGTADTLTLNTTDTTSHNTTDTETRTGTETHGTSGTDTLTLNTTDTTSHSGTDTLTHDTTDTLTHGKKTAETRNYTDTDEGTITRTETRGGNIGVTMTQQMLEADRAYWTNCLSQFYKIVCSDIIGEISYKIYTDEEAEATTA